jgi:hypothetical protein
MLLRLRISIAQGKLSRPLIPGLEVQTPLLRQVTAMPNLKCPCRSAVV